MLVCVYEDRVRQLPGVMLLVHTLSIHYPELFIRLRFPGVPQFAIRWFSQYKQVILLTEPLEGAGSYNVKPSVLLDGLSTGAELCLWLDTDILVNRRSSELARTEKDIVLTTLDPWGGHRGSSIRCERFGLKVGRLLHGPLNSALVRVSAQHTDLLKAWAAILRSEKYLGEQMRPVGQRDPLMLGDQDALSALLASSEFMHLDVQTLVHPSQILHHHGAAAFGARERFCVGHNGLPAFLHAMGGVKPWAMVDRPAQFRDWYERLYLETSPYVVRARMYRNIFESAPHWLEVQCRASRFSLMLSRNNPVYSGMVQSMIHQAKNKLTASISSISRRKMP